MAKVTDRYDDKNLINLAKEKYVEKKKSSIPTELVQLPSQGKIYPKGHVLRSGVIEIRHMTAYDEDILTNLSYIREAIVLDKLIESITDHVGELTQDNLALFRDRSILYGLDYFDPNVLDSIKQFTPLSQNIIKRKNPNVFVSKNKWTLDNVFYSIKELNRFPILIVLGNDAYDELVTCNNITRNFVDRNKISVMFRLDNKDNKNFNDYIKKNGLNNSVAKDTEIVYISSNKKYPKPLMSSDWRFKSCLYLQSQYNSHKIDSITNESDLEIHYDTVPSQYGTFRHSRSRRHLMIEEM